MPNRVYPEKFTPFNTAISEYVFARTGSFEYQPTLATRSPVLTAIGADYAQRLRGNKPALKEVGREVIRGAIRGTAAEQDTAWDTARRLTGQVGKLWLLRNDGVRRWAWAECEGMPELTINYRPNGLLAIIFTFVRTSDWFAQAAGTATQNISSNGQNFNVTNAGNLDARELSITLRALAAAGYTNPIIVNNTTGTSFATLRDSTATTSRVRLDTRRGAVEHSTNSGSSYLDDFVNYVIPTTHKVAAFRLAPGVNDIECFSGGTSNYAVDFEWDVPFA